MDLRALIELADDNGPKVWVHVYVTDIGPHKFAAVAKSDKQLRYSIIQHGYIYHNYGWMIKQLMEINRLKRGEFCWVNDGEIAVRTK